MELEPGKFLDALAEPTRLRIVALLQRHGELCVCELVQALDLPQPKVSKHLAVLRNLELIRGRRAGQWVHYRLNPGLPAWAANVIREIVDGDAPSPEFDADDSRLAAPDARNACTPA